MKPLDYSEVLHVRAASGWLDLGNLEEAQADLDRLPAEVRAHPVAMELQWAIHAQAGDWQRALEVARRLVDTAPDIPGGWVHRAYSLRRVADGGLPAAWDALLPAAERFPKEALIPFNLACYACQMNQIDGARAWLAKARALAGKKLIAAMALGDSDLKPLWSEIEAWP